ncbi:hypothetical protein HO913_02930 [Streptococcus suis]|nr:hypothetical protein [Streptococcus suis]
MQTNETLVNPKEMILSFYVKANRDARIRCFMYNPNANKDVATSDGYTAKSSADGMAVLNVTTSWQRVWIKWTYLVNYLAKPRIIIGRILETYDTDVSVDISAPALYHGHHNKEWSPAGLDFKNELATYVQSAQESSADLARRIETADGKAVDAKAYAQQTANGFNTRIESLESYKNAEGTRAEQYLSASRTETAKQLSAERVAIASNYVAKSTYTEDVRGTNQQLTEIKSTADTTKQNLANYQTTVDRKLTELTSSTQTLDGKINTASTKVDTVAGKIRTEISEVEGKIPTTIGATNYIRDFGFSNNPNFNNHTSLWKFERIADSTARSGYHIKATCTRSGSNGFHRYLIDLRGAEWQGRTMTYSVDVKASKSVRMRLGVEAFNKGYKAFDVTTEWQRFVSTDTVNFKTYYSFPFYADTITWAVGDIIYIRDPQLEDGSIATTAHAAEEDLRTDISSIKTTITQTSQGVEQLSTSLSTTDDKVTTAETKIRQLINDVSSKVSQTDYNTLTGRMTSAETAITQNATEISKRLTSTQVDKAITDKGYQTKSQVDNNITGRGYITNSALQPYALSTTVQTLVKETADSFSRTISAVETKIPTEAGGTNLVRGSAELKKGNNGWTEGHWRNSGSGGTVEYNVTLPSSPVKGIVRGAKIVSTDNTQIGLCQDGIALEPGTYTMSVWVIGNRGLKVHVSSAFSQDSSNQFSSGNTFLTLERYGWTLISQTFTIDKRYNNLSLCYLMLDTPGTVYFSAPYIHKSSMAGDWSPAPEDLATVTALHSVKDTVDSHTRTIGAVGTTGSILDNVSKVTQTANGLVQEVSGSNGLKTQVSTLAGSYAIKNLTSAGTVLNQINLLANGTNRIDGRLTHITGQTLIDNGVINTAMIGSLDAGKITSGYLSSARIASEAITADKIKVDQALFTKLMANEAYLQQLFAKNAFITQVQAVTLSASKISGGILTATNKAMEVNLNAGQILYYTDQAALKRISNGYPTQFVKFATGTVTGKGNAGVTVIGSNRWNSESSNDGGFVGIRAWNGGNIDQIDVVGDTVRFASSTFESADGWTINTLPGKLDIDAFNSRDRPSSCLSIGDVKLFRTSTSSVSLMDVLQQFNTNFKHLQNITGRGDVILTWNTIK